MPKSNPELAAEMGRRMLMRRKELGLTQEQVAEIAGMAHQQYNKSENGKTLLSSDSLLRISTALKTSADYLLTGNDASLRYFDTFKIIESMSNRQLLLANRVLRCMLEFNEDIQD